MVGEYCLLPLEIVELDSLSYHIVVKGEMNNLPCNLIIDTGASRTVFDRSYFENEVVVLDVKTDDLRTAGILADHIETVRASAATFSLDGFTLDDFHIIMIDLTSINSLYQSVTGISIHGLLGSDFLLRYEAVINFKEKTMRLRKEKG